MSAAASPSGASGAIEDVRGSTMPGTGVLPAMVLLPTLLVWAGGAAVAVADLRHRSSNNFGTPAGDLVTSVSCLSFALVGWFLVRRRASVVGWTLLAAGFFVQVWGAFSSVAAISDRAGVLFAGLVLVALPLLFPTGSFVSRLWRRFGQLAALVVVCCAAVPSIVIVLVPVVVVALACLAVRYLRSSGDVRLQLRWLGLAVVIAVGSQLVLIGLAAGLDRPTPWWFRILADASGAVVTLVPAAIGVAAIRFRLWAVDVLVDRALVLVGVATFSTAIYVALVVGVGDMLGTTTGQRTDVWLLVVATVIVSLTIDPVRRILRRATHRLVFGERVDPYELLTDYSRRVASSYSGVEALAACARAAAVATGAPSAEAWIRSGDRWEQIARWPEGQTSAGHELALESDLDRSVRTLVLHGDDVLGAVDVGLASLTWDEQQRVDDLVSSSSMLFRSVALTADLRRRADELALQAVELEDSRLRILAAEDVARQQIERDLHDGAQAMLVGLSFRLQRLREAEVAKDTAAELKQACEDLGAILAELRGLARGIHPSLLADNGLDDAVEALIERAPVSAHLAIRCSRRFHRQVEVAAYYVVVEALTNVAKHAPTSSVVVCLTADAATLHVSVRDDGPGGADPLRGTGLQGLRDRVAAVGGRCSVTSTPNAPSGTTVTAELPCA